MIQKDQLAGLLLAGGRSRRFGSDKALHRYAGRPLITHVYKAVAAVTGAVLVSVGDGEATYAIPARFVVDEVSGAGPLAGLHAGLKAARTPWLLAVACDLPFVTGEALALLIARAAPGVAAVVACDEAGRRQPLCALYHRSVLPIVEAHLREERLAMHALLAALEPVEEVMLPAGVLRNVNRPDDLAGS